MICDRCQDVIEGEPEELFVETGSAASAPIYVCPTPCRPAPGTTPKRYPPRR
ncbi:hypothetical protein [Streptomyces sp. NPDC003688]